MARLRIQRYERGAEWWTAPPTETFLPNIPPNTGMNINAINKDADNTQITVIGKNFIKLPTIPGQNSSGRNTINVVTVEAIIGQAIRTAPSRYAVARSTDCAILLSAYSIVTITPSTSIPATRISENSTTILSVIPML